jgi:hypothetical protein
MWMFFCDILYIERRIIMDKDRYIEYVNNNFDGNAKVLVLKQIELYY